MRAISESLAAWLVQHLADAMALNTYHDGWNQRASELLGELSREARHDRLWQEFDALAYNLKGQAHSGVSEETGRALLDVADRIEKALLRFPDPTDAPELVYLGEVRPGGKYLLRATDKITAEAADHVKQRLRELFPESEFGILTHDLELVQPAGDLTKQELVATLREVARTWPPHTDMHTMLQELARALTKTGDGATPPASPHATPAPTGGEQAAESATGDATPAGAPSPRTAFRTQAGGKATVDASLYEAHVRGYAIGRAQANGRPTPVTEDWDAARIFWLETP